MLLSTSLTPNARARRCLNLSTSVKWQSVPLQLQNTRLRHPDSLLWLSCRNILHHTLNNMRLFLYSIHRGSSNALLLHRSIVCNNTSALYSTNTEEEEVDGGQAGAQMSASSLESLLRQDLRCADVDLQEISWLDDEAPSCPDGTSTHERGILREREGFGWA